MITTTRKFTRHDAAAIRRATRAYMGERVQVEVGERLDGTGTLTADCTRWDEDTSDLNGIHALTHLDGTDITSGFTLDLYVSNGNPNTHGELLCNLDARWDGSEWRVYCPFAPERVETASPTR